MEERTFWHSPVSLNWSLSGYPPCHAVGLRSNDSRDEGEFA